MKTIEISDEVYERLCAKSPPDRISKELLDNIVDYIDKNIVFALDALEIGGDGTVLSQRDKEKAMEAAKAKLYSSL